MSENGTKKKSVLKSIYDRTCLTKCYPKGRTYLHPILLAPYANNLKNTCAINPVYSKDENYVTKIHDMLSTDECRIDDNLTHDIPDEGESSLSSFWFSPHDFLSSIYDLDSFDDVVKWSIENNYLPIFTIKRVNNCAWKIFGNKVEQVTDGVVNYYYDISKTYWLKDYVKKIESDYSFNFDNDTGYKKSKDVTLYDILLDRYYTSDFFHDVVKNYIYDYEDKWDMVYSHYDNLKKYAYAKLVEKINKNLTN